jgi:hypothetical protein
LARSGEPHADAAALMVRVNATLEAWVRDRPEQRLWGSGAHAYHPGLPTSWKYGWPDGSP